MYGYVFYVVGDFVDVYVDVVGFFGNVGYKVGRGFWVVVLDEWFYVWLFLDVVVVCVFVLMVK